MPTNAPAMTLPLSLTQQMRPSGEQIDSARRRLHRKAAFVLVLALASYSALVFAPVGFFLRVVFMLVLVVAVVAIATGIMHDGNHGAFSLSKRVNRLAGWSSDLLGASSYLWRFKHNRLHHGNTNVVGYDLDIDQVPFARLTPAQPWRPRHRYQHLYMWVLYGFLTVRWLLIADFTTLLRGKQGIHPLPAKPSRRSVATIIAGKVLHVGWAFVLPTFFHPWWGVLGFYLVASWLVGFLLANFFQLAHCVDRAEFFTASAPRRGADFELHQLRTTVDIRTRTPLVGRFVHWLMGGLDYQIEHHLAPKLPHTIYPLIAAQLEAACAAQGVTYRTHPSLIAAIRSHARWLRRMGQPPRNHEASILTTGYESDAVRKASLN